MPKSNFTIRGFQGGLNGSANQEDVPAEGTPFALNLDPINPRGSLRGIRQDASVLTTEIGSDELILAGHMTVDGKNYTLLATKSGSSVELYTWDGSVVNKLAMPATLNYGQFGYRRSW